MTCKFFAHVRVRVLRNGRADIGCFNTAGGPGGLHGADANTCSAEMVACGSRSWSALGGRLWISGAVADGPERHGCTGEVLKQPWDDTSARAGSFAVPVARCGSRGGAGFISPNPVPFSGQAITDVASCRDRPNTWFYDQILKETGESR